MNGTLRSDAEFVCMTAALILLSHAVAFFAHEFAHSFLAWALGFKENPLALDFGDTSPGNLLLQLQVEENVDYAIILADGHGLSAALIALAGVFLGNGVLYCTSYAGLRLRASKKPSASTCFLFWLGMMCAGNVWSYMPLRALATHADIATAARGIGLSALALLPFLALPSLLIVLHFFRRMCVLMVPIIGSSEPGRRGLMIALVATWFFVFFGGVGFSGSYGPVSQSLSIISEWLLFPFSFMWLWRTCPISPSAEP